MGKKARLKEERRQKRRAKRIKKALKERMGSKKKRYIPCAVCKERTLVGDRSVIRVFCGNCIVGDSYGVIRTKLGKSFQRISDAYKILHKDEILEAKANRAVEVKALMKVERKKKRIDRKRITNYITRYWKKKKVRIERGNEPRRIKTWIKVK